MFGCRALFNNLGQKFVTKYGTQIWDRQTDGQTDKTRYRVALQLKMVTNSQFKIQQNKIIEFHLLDIMFYSK